ncbi:MAG: PDZ domain-containing protein [Luteolibacter sp.]
MVSLSRPSRPVLDGFLQCFSPVAVSLIASIGVANGEPRPIAVEFLPTATKAVAITAPESRFIVSVYAESAPLTKAHMTAGGNKTALEFAGQDTTTRLCFFRNPGDSNSSPATWAESFGKSFPENLQAITHAGTIPCRYDNWITQVGDKVLPLGLLSITFTGEVPASGTPLIDASGKIVGIILQPVSPRTAYAIPAQAVRRVQHDIAVHRKLVRGWLGISLSTESTVPRITRVWPDSPADKAGISEGDILVSVSGSSTSRYPDAVNALFYAIPGQPTQVQVSRKNQRISCEITPVPQKPGE